MIRATRAAHAVTRAIAVAVAVAIVTAQAVAQADERRAIEVDLFGGYHRTIAPHAVPADPSRRIYGAAFAVAVTYRSSYFLSPFVEAGYVPVYASYTVADLGSLGRAAATSSLAVVPLVGGPQIDLLDRLRLRVGLGGYDVFVRSNVRGVGITAGELDLGMMASATAFVVDARRLRIGAEIQASLVVEANVSFVSLGATFAGDVLSF